MEVFYKGTWYIYRYNLHIGAINIFTDSTLFHFYFINYIILLVLLYYLIKDIFNKKEKRWNIRFSKKGLWKFVHSDGKMYELGILEKNLDIT